MALGASLVLGLVPGLPATASVVAPHAVTIAAAPIEDTTKASDRRWALPLKSKTYRLSSPRGPRCIPVIGGSTHHLGQDLGSQNGDPIYAVTDGVVRKTLNGTSSVSGQIILKHAIGGKNYETAYLHMWNATTHVKAGQKVNAGQRIGSVGSSGPSTGPHLHLEVWKERFYSNDANLLDPATWLGAQGISMANNASRAYPQTPPGSCTYYARGMIDVFTNADSGSKVLAKVPRNAAVTSKPGAINGMMNGNYVKLTYGKSTGWVNRYAVTPNRMGDAPAGSLTSAGADTDGMLLPMGRYRANGTVNLRTGTATWYSVMGQVKAGSMVDVYQSKSGWLRVSSGGKIGWVSASLFTRTGTSDPATAKPTRETIAATVLRKGAGTKYAESGKLAAGARVAIRRNVGGWMEVQAGKTTGWVPASALKAIGAATPKPPAAPKPAAPKPPVPKATHKTTNGLNLRQGPASATKSLRVLGKGTGVAVLKSQGTWRQVRVGADTGWVAAAYLQAIKPTAPVKPKPPVTKPSTPAKPKPSVVRPAAPVKPKPIAKPKPSVAKPKAPVATHRSTKALKLKKSASVKSASVRSLAKGTKLAVLKKQGSWRYVQVGTKRGWVAASALTSLKPATPKITKIAQKKYTLKSRTSARKGPGTSYGALKVLPKGYRATVNARSGSWMRFTVNGKSAWVPSSQLTVVKPSAVKLKKTTNNVHLRSGASASTKRLLTVPKGKQLKVLATKSGWTKTTYGKRTGWLNSRYLK